MSLKSMIQEQVTAGMDMLGDLLTDMFYTGSPSAYDPVAGTTTAGAVSTVTGVITDYSVREISGVIQGGDKKIIFDKTKLETDMEVGGTLTVGTTIYQIKDIYEDPSGSIIVVQGRR